MRKWAFAAIVAFFAIVSVAAGAVALTDDGGGEDGGARVSRDSGDGDKSGGDGSASDCTNPPCDDVSDGGLAICLEGAIDCDDTIEPPADHVCIQIYPAPPECVDPDAPVSNIPPIVDAPSPNACSIVHNVEACERQAVDAAVQDLARNTGVAPESITVSTVDFVEWPDACLGVQNPKLACAEVITPGFRIILVIGETSYGYRTDLTASVILGGQ